MPQWKTTDVAASKPKYANNSTVFGVSKAEAKATGKSVSAGWVKVTIGTGYVNLKVGTPGTGYTNADTVVVSSTNPGVVNATANIVSGVGGSIAGFSNVKYGSGYINNTSVAITTAGGTGGVVIAELGGRAGRKQFENLTATKITGENAADDTLFPGA
jgi:hypothetical protein